LSKALIDAIAEMCEEDALVITNDQLDGGTPLAYMMTHGSVREDHTQWHRHREKLT